MTADPPPDPLQLDTRLRAIEQALDDLAMLLAAVVNRLSRLSLALERTDHYGLGRRGVDPEEEGRT